jgi:hypothetical protein
MNERNMDYMAKQTPKDECTQHRQQIDLLTHRLRQFQRVVFGAVFLLRRPLGPDYIDGREVNETASEQVERADRVMKVVVAQLMRLVDADVLSQGLAEQTIELFGRTGSRLPDDAAWQLDEEYSMDGPHGLLVALKQLAGALQSHQDLDCCVCAELGGLRCLFCTTADALELGERWLSLLDLETGQIS